MENASDKNRKAESIEWKKVVYFWAPQRSYQRKYLHCELVLYWARMLRY